MNGQLNKSLVNPWLASVGVLRADHVLLRERLPDLAAPAAYDAGSAAQCHGGRRRSLVGAAQVFAGLTLMNRVGGATFCGLQ
jgi:transporter family-2 protein